MRKGHADPGEQLKVARIATLGLGVVAVALGITFKGQNVAFMVSLAFAIAASANFPALVLAIFWRGYTTAGAVTSMVAGTVTALTLIYLSPTLQVDILGRTEAWFPAQESGAGDDAILVPGRHRRLAPGSRALGGRGVRPRGAAHASGGRAVMLFTTEARKTRKKDMG